MTADCYRRLSQKTVQEAIQEAVIGGYSGGCYRRISQEAITGGCHRRLL